MSETRLLNCPFCGGEAEWATNKKQWVQCKNCRAETTFYEKTEEAIEAWNTRKPLERIVERLEEHEEKHFHQDFEADRFEFGAYVATYTAIEIVREEGGLSE